MGPVHEYVAPPIVEAVSDNVFPEQTAELLPAMGAEGSGVITTTVVPADPVHPAAEVAVTEYVPPLAATTDAMLGFCTVEVKLFGPLHK